MAKLNLSLLGSFKAHLDQEPITDFSTDKARALLAYLAVEADRGHRRDALAGLLWPDQPQQKARQNLRQAISHLRQALGEHGDAGHAGRDTAGPFLLVTRQTVQFNSSSDHWLDVTAFKTLVRDCQAHRHSRPETCLPCIRRMEQMITLYQGSFLEQFFLSDSALFEEWASLEREWLHRQAVEAISHLANYHERCGDFAQARQYAWRQVELEPWREEAHRHLMRLFALDGQRSAALFQYETCRQALAEELGVEPMAETTALYEQISKSPSQQIGEYLQTHRLADLHNLPHSPTPFVGRKEELAELAELLANPDCRLVTLVGPGGIGKTRLALQAAMEQIGAFDHGVYHVPLVTINSAEFIVPAIADALQFPFYDPQNPKEQLLNYLQKKEMLLVLDSTEHLLGKDELVAEILKHAPNVVLLVTSRERLNLREEWIYKVEGLPYPESPLTSSLHRTPDVQTYSAVELFEQHARQMHRRFAISETNAGAVVRICQLVEGMPLAIELAAAWVRVRSCEAIAREIEHNLDVLTTRLRNVPERHRSIRATFEYSWQLLTEEEKDVLTRLSVFRGGFGQHGASVIAGASLSVFSALLDQSLIYQVTSDRYDMHALLRQYATEKLEASPGAREQSMAQHSRYFTTFLEQQEKRLKGAEQKQAILEIASETGNVRQAWQWAVSRGDARQVEQSLDSLYHFCDIQCRFQEGIDLFGQAIDKWRNIPEQDRVLGRVLSRQGALYDRIGLYEEAKAALEQSLEIFERLDLPSDQAFCLVHLANVLRHQGKRERTEQLAQQSLVLSKQIRDHWSTARALYLQGMVRFRAGEIDRAKALFEQSLTISRESGNPRLMMSILNALGDVACHRGNFTKAQAAFEECLALSRELDDQFHTAIHLNNLGTLFHELEEYKKARALYQESSEICKRIGDQTGWAIALGNLGRVAHELGAYSEAMALYREGLSIGRKVQNQWTIIACLNNLGQTACAMEDYGAARTYLSEALQVATETQTVVMLSEILVNVAVLMAKQGQPDRAAALLELAHRHPASEQAVQERAGRLLDEMGLAPPDDVPGPLEKVVAEILAEISPSEPETQINADSH